jgi:hypothetical protein
VDLPIFRLALILLILERINEPKPLAPEEETWLFELPNLLLLPLITDSRSVIIELLVCELLISLRLGAEEET